MQANNRASRGSCGPHDERSKERGASAGEPTLGENVVFPQKIDFAVGGQALIEGVMIRAPSWITIAVRKPNGEIILKKEPFTSLTKRVKIFGAPILRGIIQIIETMALGMRALNFSAEISLDEEPEVLSNESFVKQTPTLRLGLKEKSRTQKMLAVASFIFSIIFSIALAIFLFKFVPLWITEQLRTVWPALQKSVIFFNLIDGLLRITIFFLYIFILSRFKTIRRVFEYHGAEHKSVFAYEKGHPLTPEYVKKESPRHPRCGTSFIIIVLIVSILLLSLVPRHPDFFINFFRRLSIIPLIMGVGYEVLKWTAKRQHHPIMKFLTYPGILTQYITTKEPDEKQIEVALAAIKAAVELEKKSGRT
jgi:uncharacterized protein YqhQ